MGTNYLIVLERENFEDRMIVRVEVRPEFFKGDLRQLENLRSADYRSPEVRTPGYAQG